jgi:SAM-dependent methyltransferase
MLPQATKTPGELRYRLRCIDKLGYRFRGDERLLDSGCGDGGVARLLRERVGEVVAIDVELSDSWANDDGLMFSVANAEELPFADGEFDIIHSKDSLHHMEDPDRAIQEYRRVLKPGGTVLIVEANRYNPIFWVHMTKMLGHEHFPRKRFHALVRSAFPDARFGRFEGALRAPGGADARCPERGRGAARARAARLASRLLQLRRGDDGVVLKAVEQPVELVDDLVDLLVAGLR